MDSVRHTDGTSHLADSGDAYGSHTWSKEPIVPERTYVYMWGTRDILDKGIRRIDEVGSRTNRRGWDMGLEASTQSNVWVGRSCSSDTGKNVANGRVPQDFGSVGLALVACNQYGTKDHRCCIWHSSSRTDTACDTQSKESPRQS
jgi:hypothetical protein